MSFLSSYSGEEEYMRRVYLVLCIPSFIFFQRRLLFQRLCCLFSRCLERGTGSRVCFYFSDRFLFCFLEGSGAGMPVKKNMKGETYKSVVVGF